MFLLPWQQLLTMPPQQMLVIERMHSGARRFVVLDFGAPVLLTDLIIPACSDLVSLSIDIWVHCEETDGLRLVVASDIGSKSLIMSDLQPPPVCRFLKVRVLAYLFILKTVGKNKLSRPRCSKQRIQNSLLLIVSSVLKFQQYLQNIYCRGYCYGFSLTST